MKKNKKQKYGMKIQSKNTKKLVKYELTKVRDKMLKIKTRKHNEKVREKFVMKSTG